MTLPASPAFAIVPMLLLEMLELLARVAVPTLAVMVPAFCGPAVAAETEDALVRVKEPAATVMSPPASAPSAFVNRELWH